jgi:hypothetical protein
MSQQQDKCDVAITEKKKFIQRRKKMGKEGYRKGEKKLSDSRKENNTKHVQSDIPIRALTL